MADYTMNVKVIHLTKSTSDWATFDTTIPAGMLCIETTATGETKQKVGDGNNTFANLPYVTTREMTGATALADGVSGMVPAPQAGDQNKYLSGAGTWEELPEESIPVKYRVKEGTRIGATGATDSFTLQVSTDNGVTWSDVNTDQGSGHTTYSLGLFATTASGDDEVVRSRVRYSRHMLMMLSKVTMIQPLVSSMKNPHIPLKSHRLLIRFMWTSQPVLIPVMYIVGLDRHIFASQIR